MMEIELPPEIQELIHNYDENCLNVERHAVDTVSAFEIPVFNCLRDISARNCYLALCSLPKWFGSPPTIEHCTCLMVLTEYISYAYNNTNFYDTFVKTKTDKFYESFFMKLCNEWQKLFHRMSYDEFSSYAQFNCLKTSLQKSFHRFPESFMYKGTLRDIIAACENFGTKLKIYFLTKSSKINSGSLPTTHLKELNSSNAAKPSSIVKFMTNNSCNKAVDKPLPLDSLVRNCNKAVRGAVRNSLTVSKPDQIARINEPKTFNQIHAVREPEVIVIDDVPSPAKKPCKTSSEENSVINSVIPKIEAFKDVRTSLKPIENSIIHYIQPKSFQSNVDKETTTPATPLPKKLNAFDILMRRTVMKKKNIS